MPQDNFFARAMELAQQDYVDDKAIQSIVSNFKTKLRAFQISHSPRYYDPLSPYLDALSGKSGCSLMLGNDTISNMIEDPVRRMLDLNTIQTLAEQLIFTLQAYGEEIEY